MDFQELLDSLNNSLAISHPTDASQPGVSDVAARLDNDLAISHPTQTLKPTTVDDADTAFLDKEMGGNQDAIPLPDKSKLLASIEPTSVSDADQEAPNALVARLPVKPTAAAASDAGSNAPTGRQDTNDVASFIAKKYGYGQGLDDQALQAAQKVAQQGRYSANMGDAVASIIHGIAHSNQPIDNSYYKGLAEQSGQPVQDIFQRRQAAQQEQNFATQQEDLDPNSVKATIMRKAYAPLAIQNHLDPAILNGLGVTDLKAFAAGPLEFAAKMNELKQSHADQLAMRKLMSSQQLSEKELAREQHSYDSLQNDPDYKTARGQVYSSTQLSNLAQQATQNPTAASALTTEAARYVSGGQRLHSSTIDAFKGGSPAIMDRLKQVVQTGASGTLTPANAKFMQDFIKSESTDARNTMNSIEQDRAQSFQKMYGKTPTWYQPPQSQPATSNANPTHAPGSIIQYQGKRYRVGADGDSLEPM